MLQLSPYGQTVTHSALGNSREPRAHLLRKKIEGCWRDNFIHVDELDLGLLRDTLGLIMRNPPRIMLQHVIAQHLHFGIGRALAQSVIDPERRLDFQEGNLRLKAMLIFEEMPDSVMRELPHVLEAFAQEHFPHFGFAPVFSQTRCGTPIPVAFGANELELSKKLATELEAIPDMPPVDFRD